MRVKSIKDTKKYQGNYLAEGYVDENGDLIEYKPIIIATALYRSPSVSTETLQRIMNCLQSAVEIEGSSYLYFLNRHINNWGVPRKTRRDILPVINVIWKNFLDNMIPKKLEFHYRIDETKYIVSPSL